MHKLIVAVVLLATMFPRHAAADTTWLTRQWTPPYDFSLQPSEFTYTALEAASRKWRLCAFFPHLKDPYWLAINYEIVERAKQLGIALGVFGSGGYPDLDRQVAQLRSCASGGYNAILLGSVSYDRMTPAVIEAAKSVPVFATVNQIMGEGNSGMAAVNWADMGRAAGERLTSRYPQGASRRSRLRGFQVPRLRAGYISAIRVFAMR